MPLFEFTDHKGAIYRGEEPTDPAHEARGQVVGALPDGTGGFLTTSLKELLKAHGEEIAEAFAEWKASAKA